MDRPTELVSNQKLPQKPRKSLWFKNIYRFYLSPPVSVAIWLCLRKSKSCRNISGFSSMISRRGFSFACAKCFRNENRFFWLWFHATTFANWVLFNMIVRYRCKCISEVDTYVMQMVGYRLAGQQWTGNEFSNAVEMMLHEGSCMIYIILLCRNIYLLQIVVADIKTKYLGKNMH